VQFLLKPPEFVDQARSVRASTSSPGDERVQSVQFRIQFPLAVGATGFPRTGAERLERFPGRSGFSFGRHIPLFDPSWPSLPPFPDFAPEVLRAYRGTLARNRGNAREQTADDGLVQVVQAHSE